MTRLLTRMPNDATDLTDLQPTVTIPSPIQKAMDGWWLYPVRAQPHHTDYAGIVWHGSYITWLEEARVECLRHGGVDFAACVALGCDLPVAAMALKYHKSVQMGMAVVVWLRLVPRGVRWNFDYEIRSMDGQVLFVTAEVTLVAVDRTTGKIMRRLPPMIQTALAQLL
jgi:acyl-CoA thioester hydrolase